MARLTRYLVGLFTAEAMALFGVAAFLLYLTQCLRLFDLVSDKGQSLPALLGQAALGMPALLVVFLYVCLGIGMGRALRNLQASNELQIVHVNDLLPTLFRAVGLYAIGGAAAALIVAHLLAPLSVRASNDWTASIAADLVSRSMIPHKFTEVADKVSMVIGARDGAGNIEAFFADDQRDPGARRSYIAKAAIIAKDAQGYVLRMQDGAIQTLTTDHRFSQISFERYDLPLDQLTSGGGGRGDRSEVPSFDLILEAIASGTWDPATVRVLVDRSTEGLRVLAMCILVAALAAFPTGKRRGIEVPIEMVVLGVAFLERAVSSYLPGPELFSAATGSMVLLGLAAVILPWRLRLVPATGVRRRAA